jgi:hypothetical protein
MLATIFACALAVNVIGQEAKPDPRENLETAIPEAIRLLEAKDYLALIKHFVHPDDLKKLEEQGKSPEKLAEQFGEKKAERLHAVLKEIKDKKPELNDDGSQAVFKVDDKPGGVIRFHKSGKLWCIRN